MGKPLLIIVGCLFMLFSMTVMNMQSREAQVFERLVSYYSEQHAENVSNSVAEHAIKHVQLNVNYAIDIEDPVSYMGTQVTLEIEETGNYQKRIRAVSTYENKQAVTEVMMLRESLSKYAYYTNRESSVSGDPIWFHSMDVLYGPVHTNGTFHFMGTPTFYGDISSPNQPVRQSGADPDFRAGEYFGDDYHNNENITRIEHDNISDLQAAAASSSMQFEGKIELEFLGESGVRIVDSDGEEHVYSLEELEASDGYQVVIFSDGEISLKGEVKGSYTVFSNEDIRIEGDVTYHTPPDDDRDSGDILGIVSEKNVIVSKDAHTDNGSEDVHIHASIMALGDSFYVEDYDQGSKRGELHILGGIIQETRGAVGMMRTTRNRWGHITTSYSGFEKNYKYDDRLEKELAPPFFPRAENYVIDSWLTTVRAHSQPQNEPPL